MTIAPAAACAWNVSTGPVLTRSSRWYSLRNCSVVIAGLEQGRRMQDVWSDSAAAV